MSVEKVATQVGNAEYIFETGRMAKQAHGAVVLQCGGTVVMAAVVFKPEADQNKDFFPLTVDYRERTYAAGKIPGGYFKREGRPTEREILTSRIIDRPIRPLFPEGYMNDTQITVTVLSFDGENQPDILAMNAASAALMISESPFNKALGAVRVGLIGGNLVTNPSFAQLEESDLDLVVACTEEKIVMIEAGAKEVTEEKMMEALEYGHNEAKKLIAAQKSLAKKVGRTKKPVVGIEIPAAFLATMKQATQGEFERIFTLPLKENREEARRELYKKLMASFTPAPEGFRETYAKLFFEKLESEKLREFVLEKGKRTDGRDFKEIRQITCEVGVLPRTHGSALFTRGQTQALCVTTLGTGDDEQMIDSLEGDVSKRFMLHYNFPPFSVGETGPNRGPGRREIGHGALAERALLPIMPSADDFPYTVRLVSDIFESNGSSSMASVCGGTLALMDAGVPVKAPVAGIALGLVSSPKKWQVVTDIAGIEDHHGEMDFKAAGTTKGLTALQMDMKIDGITRDQLIEAFSQAKVARMKILDMIKQTIPAPKEMSQYAPRIVTIKINPEKIGMIIGPGGKNIKKIVEDTGAKIDIEDDGRIFISSVDASATEAAIARIQGVTQEAEVGKIYQGKVRKLMAFGAFCEIIPGTDGLCHISEVTEGFAKNVADYLHVGDIVPVKVVGVDDMGKISLSIKQAKEGGMPMLPPDVERDIVDSGGGRGGGRDRDRGDRPRSRSRR